MNTCIRYSSIMYITLGAAAAIRADIRIEQIPGQAELGTVEIHGVSAGPFDATIWQRGTLHVLPDMRSPLISPRVSGVFRNIYAPSAVKLPEGWRLFYGAWDGVDTTNDRIYSLTTKDFLDFEDRTTVIEHGAFVHVCNVNAIRQRDGSFRMVCTVYPDDNGRNKIAGFSSPDGRVWNGAPAPYPASKRDIIEIEGYPAFSDADMNGMNVLLQEGGEWHLYFGDFRQHTHVWHASSRDGRHFSFQGPCLKSQHMVNDVKKLDRSGTSWYLMGLHANTDRLWYALSRDGKTFAAEQQLITRLGDADRYIVAMAWVVKDHCLLGFLYGAGAVPQLHRNRIYARWLQKKVVFTDTNETTHEPIGSLGPDRQIISLRQGAKVEGQVQLFAEDGVTASGSPVPTTLESGCIYRLHQDD